MLPVDCVQKVSADGKKKALFIQAPSGKQYKVIRPLGSGGVGKIYLVSLLDKNAPPRQYVVKEYPVPTTPEMRAQQKNIRKNLKELIEKPVPSDIMVSPIEIVDFPKTGTFGYVMNYVDTSEYVSVSRLKENYPQADIICKMALNIVRFFDLLAGSAGKCYKDVNEGNIYLNPRTGDVRIIDNDNVGEPSVRTITGTGYYMAPEVLMGLNDPDRLSDRFSMAVFLLRLFVGAIPYEGIRASNYMDREEKNIYEAAPVIFGSEALFIFDPDDSSNTIRNYQPGAGATEEQKQQAKKWKKQCQLWDNLPEKIREAFIITFSKGAKPENRSQRFSASQWTHVLEQEEKVLTVCPSCHRKTFGSSHCFYCGKSNRTVNCSNCQKKTTTNDAKICVNCGRDYSVASVEKVKCQFCGAENNKNTQICTSCHKFIWVKCGKCGKTQPGNLTTCCNVPLFRNCSFCGTVNESTAAVCRKCGKALSSTPSQKCPGCGRQTFPGERECKVCGTKLSDSGSGSDTVYKLKIDAVSYLGANWSSLSISCEFPKGRTVYADEINPRYKHVPLFSFRYNPKRKACAVVNCSGSKMTYIAAGTSIQQSKQDGELVVISRGDVVAYRNDLMIRITSIQI